jgi:glycosyltransferase involved in cell wall biosynthesis
MERALAAVDVRVTVATTDDDGPKRRMAVPLGRAVPVNGATRFYFRKQTEFYKCSLPLWRWLRAQIQLFDLVHVHALFSFASVAAARCARNRGIPYILRPLGVLNHYGMARRRPGLKRLSFACIERPLLHSAAAMHYTSEQEQIEAEAAGAPGRAAILPLAIDTGQFEHLPGPEAFLRRFPEAANRSRVLFLSRLDPKKGLDLLLPAFACVRQQHPSTMLVIAGSGDPDYAAGLRAMEARLGLTGHVLWTGFLDGPEKLSAFSAATLFVLPSYSENFGIALIEALAAGLPCLTTDGVGLSNTMLEREAGLVVPAEVAGLAAALDRLLGDAKLRSRLLANGRRLAAERFSLEAMGTALKALYEQIVSNR